MTRKALLAVGFGGVVASTIGIATAQPSIADSFYRTIYTTSPEQVLISDNTVEKVDVGAVEIKEVKPHRGLFRRMFGMFHSPMGFFRHKKNVSLIPASTTTFAVVPSTVTTRTVESAAVVDDSVGCNRVLTTPAVIDSSCAKVITAPAVIEKASCSHAKVISSPAVVDMTVESPAVIRSTTGKPFMVEQLHAPVLRKVISRPSLIQVNRVVDRPAVIERVVSQPTVIEKFVEKPAIVETMVAQPTVIAAPTVIKKSITSPVIILDDPSDRFLYDFSTHKMLKIDLDD
jgi:hypothetical protein